MEGEALYEFLYDAVLKHGEFEDPDVTLRDIAEHGADAGWPGFTTYQETGEFHDKYKSEIWDLVYELSQETGDKTPLAFLAGLKGAEQAETVDGFENLMTWLTLEEVARWATEEDEEEGDNPGEGGDDNEPDDNPKKKLSDMDKLVRGHWDIKGLAADLKGQEWEQTEPHRIDRLAFVASAGKIDSLAKEALSDQELKEAEETDTLPEVMEDVTNEYMDALAGAVAEVMGEHVYGTFEADDAFIGQYEDGDITELEAKGYVIRK